ncbi:MAG: hypothetical protein JSS79_18255 [Bacteroidetes bacterium]|nr:hypothetical protein [Bacteroidota bacterium]
MTSTRLFPIGQSIGKDGKELSVSMDCLAIKAIATSGTDLLMLGLSTSGWVYWKNGTPVTIIDTTSFQVNALATSASDVYVSGYSEPAGLLTVRNATCWKNGSIVFRAPSPSYAMGVAVSGSDVYLAGYIPGNDAQHNTAVYWKNGVAVTLTDGTTNAMAYSILVSGSDVYAVGAENKVACYWKNGVKVNLGDGSAVSEAFSMAIKGSAIHAAGYLGSHPCWWVNGTAQSLEGGTADGAALQVVVN